MKRSKRPLTLSALALTGTLLLAPSPMGEPGVEVVSASAYSAQSIQGKSSFVRSVQAKADAAAKRAKHRAALAKRKADAAARQTSRVVTGQRSPLKDMPKDPPVAPKPPVVAPPAPPAPPVKPPVAPPAPAPAPVAPPAPVPAPVKPAPAPVGEFGFMHVNADGSAVRWNPCAPIPYKLNLAHAPAGAKGEVDEALRRISAASGLRFQYDGTSTLVPGRDAAPLSGITIAWAPASASPHLQGDVSGSAGPAYTVESRQGPDMILSATALFNVDHDSQYRPGFGPGMTRGNLVLHELGHAVGLDHVHSEKELMSPWIASNSPDGFASGDLVGLKRLGTGDCLTR